jgi:hypothetical protein
MWQAKAGTDYARWRAVFAVNGVLARCGRNKLLFDEQWSSQVFVPFLAVRRIHTLAEH